MKKGEPGYVQLWNQRTEDVAMMILQGRLDDAEFLLRHYIKLQEEELGRQYCPGHPDGDGCMGQFLYGTMTRGKLTMAATLVIARAVNADKEHVSQN